MGTAFVVDTYNGAALFRSTAVETIYMCVFLIVPILTFAITLMARYEDPWRTTAGIWAIMVCITFMVWGLAVTYKQVETCSWIVERKYFKGDEDEVCAVKAGDESSTTGSTRSTSWSPSEQEGREKRPKQKRTRLGEIAMRSILLTQRARYSGVKWQRFNILAGEDVASSQRGALMETSVSLYSRFTALSALSFMFETLDSPKRMYSAEEAREMLPFSACHLVSW